MLPSPSSTYIHVDFAVILYYFLVLKVLTPIKKFGMPRAAPETYDVNRDDMNT